jgi:chemotaxis protein methyltransferase CheR
MLWNGTNTDAMMLMTEDERVQISSYIEDAFGIKMSEAKKPLLTGRLSKRLRILRINSYGEYFNYIHSVEGRNEFRIFTDLVSTHETHFFRENGHFEFLSATGLPALVNRGSGTDVPLNIMSAACSTGEEVYSAACTIEEFAAVNSYRNFRYYITGTDLSSNVINTAAKGIYETDDINRVPVKYRKYFMKSRNSSHKLIRVIPEIRTRTRFIEMNLLDDSFTFDCIFDIIFCRNVMIYFSKENQRKVVEHLCRFLHPGGYLLVGHSENLLGLDLPIKLINTATYVKTSQVGERHAN